MKEKRNIAWNKELIIRDLNILLHFFIILPVSLPHNIAGICKSHDKSNGAEFYSWP